MSQTGLRQFTDAVIARPGSFNIIERVKDAVTGIASDIGVPFDLFTARPGEIPDDVQPLRYQYSTVFEFYTRDANGDTEIGHVQFRTTVYVVSNPSDEFKEYIKSISHRRLHTLFNSGVYDGYMEGFGFISRDANEEDPPQPVGLDEVPPTGLGVPNFSCEVYDDDGAMVGHSNGYSLDFGVHKQQVQTDEAPGQETWRVRSFNDARGDYEVSPAPNSPARERAKNASGKVAYINGMPVGSITSRGSVWLTKEHQRPGAATYRSRQYITDHTATPYQALSPGSKLYKVRESPDGVYFSTVEPSGFQSTDPDTINPGATGAVEDVAALDFDADDPTEFVVTEDEADEWALGERSLTTTVEIDHETTFTIHGGW